MTILYLIHLVFFGDGMIVTPLNHKNKHSYTCFRIYKMRALDQMMDLPIIYL